MGTAIAYMESFGCALETLTEDGYEHGDHAGDCQWGFRCNICGTVLADSPCPDHAPLSTPGLMLVSCDAEPRHLSWVLAHDGYEGPCWQCAYLDLQAEHGGCAHRRHRAWGRWKITHKLAGWGYSLGFVKTHGWTSGRGCNGCMTGFRWGRSPYLLGWDNWKWQALRRCLRNGHWPAAGDECTRASDGRDVNFCVKCAPCLGCGICQPPAVTL